jgi:putative membrane protein
MTDTRVKQRVSDSGLSALVGAFAVLLGGAIVLSSVDLGPSSRHMAAHIASMNIAAPLLAVLLRAHLSARRRPSPVAALWLATVIQVGLLWASHAPAIHHAAQAHFPALLGLHASLFLAALAFWLCIIEATPNARWHAMLALLVCGKLACLLGALLIFAPRVLLASPGASHLLQHGPADHAAALADQHLAGLLMVVACPLSYVAAAIVLAAQTMSALERGAVSARGRLAGR